MKRLVFALALAAVMTSCSKKEEVYCLAGLGGDLQVRVLPTHNGNPIISNPGARVKVYIAFGMSEFPGKGEGNYNKVVSGKDNNDFVTCYNLKCGMYYFYAVYEDADTGETWSGGSMFTSGQQDGTLDLPITLTTE